tara:strand:+ start:68447 stop:69583 length:1137 start_codon:yes stop_codon:yes gene_type:complete
VTQWRDDEKHVRNKSFGPVKKVSKDVAYQRFTKWLSDEFYAREVIRNPSGLLAVHDLCREYLVFAAGYYRDEDGKQTTEVRNIHYTLTFYNNLYGEEPLHSLGPIQLRDFQVEMIKQDKARTLINKMCEHIRRMVRWAVSEELLDSRVLYAIESVTAIKKGRSPKKGTPPARESEKVVAAPLLAINKAKQFLPHTVCAMIDLQMLTAMRPQDVCGMRLIDIDMSDHDVWIYEPDKFKTKYRGDRRTIFLGPRCQGIIKPFMNREPVENLFKPEDAQLQRNAARRGDKEAPRTNKGYGDKYRPFYDTASYRKTIRRACESAKIDIWSPNQLRHYAHDEYEKMLGIEITAGIMGHSDVTTTKLYGERQLQRAREAALKFA